jgi:hypothetical protein
LVSLRDLRAANGAVKLVRVVHTERLGLFRQPRTGSTLPVDGWTVSPVNTHQGKIVTINQLDYYTPDAHTQMNKNIHFLGDSKITYESVGVGLLKYSSLMGNFPTPLAPTTKHIAMVNMILNMSHQSFESFDPWIMPSPLEFDTLGDTMPLSSVEVEYDVIHPASPSLGNQHLLESTTYSLPSWLDSLPSTFDYILHIFPSNESIMKILSIEEAPWDGNHHRSYFIPNLDEIEKYISSIFPSDIIDSPQSPILTQDTISEGNLRNISHMITIDISINEGIVENIQLGANCLVE